MPKLIAVTLPDPLYAALSTRAESLGVRPTTLAFYLIESQLAGVPLDPSRVVVRPRGLNGSDPQRAGAVLEKARRVRAKNVKKRRQPDNTHPAG